MDRNGYKSQRPIVGVAWFRASSVWVVIVAVVEVGRVSGFLLLVFTT